MPRVLQVRGLSARQQGSKLTYTLCYLDPKVLSRDERKPCSGKDSGYTMHGDALAVFCIKALIVSIDELVLGSQYAVSGCLGIDFCEYRKNLFRLMTRATG